MCDGTASFLLQQLSFQTLELIKNAWREAYHNIIHSCLPPCVFMCMSWLLWLFLSTFPCCIWMEWKRFYVVVVNAQLHTISIPQFDKSSTNKLARRNTQITLKSFSDTIISIMTFSRMHICSGEKKSNLFPRIHSLEFGIHVSAKIYIRRIQYSWWCLWAYANLWSASMKNMLHAAPVLAAASHNSIFTFFLQSNEF